MFDVLEDRALAVSKGLYREAVIGVFQDRLFVSWGPRWIAIKEGGRTSSQEVTIHALPDLGQLYRDPLGYLSLKGGKRLKPISFPSNVIKLPGSKPDKAVA